MRPHRCLPSVVGLALFAVACSGGSAAEDPGPIFDSEGGRTVACMVHQPAPPGSPYTDPGRRDSGQLLTLLHYYTVNGSKPYCDGQPPGAVDRRWAQLYVDLGADPAACCHHPEVAADPPMVHCGSGGYDHEDRLIVVTCTSSSALATG